MDELKLCPFCGGIAEVCGMEYYWVECKSCGVETKGSEYRNEAVDRWNRREDNETD